MQIVEAIKSIADGDEEGLLNSEVLFEAVKIGILDAPALKSFSVAKGEIKTTIMNGQCRFVNENREVLSEIERLSKILRGVKR